MSEESRRRPLKVVPALSAVAVAVGLTLYFVSDQGGCIPETCGQVVGSTLRTLHAAQEASFARDSAYATEWEALEIYVAPEVTLELLYADPRGWSARATHGDLPDMSCVMWDGDVPSAPLTERGMTAQEPARLYCDFPT